jgi:lysine-ketoglutarate reductase/saccharopine dehydrogenase-like protein (TIGR00300 family)
MAFNLPAYTPPDFTRSIFSAAPTVTFKPVRKSGVAPDTYHSTSIYPEYFHVRKGEWRLLTESRMDCVVVLDPDGTLHAREFRRLKKGDRVACGRRENGEDGIFVHLEAFSVQYPTPDKFVFRSQRTRETSFSIDYDELYGLLKHERRHGFIVWVLGPAISFDQDSRSAFSTLIERGYVHALLAGNALATHDVEGALFGTALGQQIYSKRVVHLGHYHHLDAINAIRGAGSIANGVSRGLVKEGIMHAAIQKGIPFVLAGSIRDDGPMPDVIGDVYHAQDEMRALTRRATTVIALATQLHAIAAGNLLPSYTVRQERVRPVYFYMVDMSEYAVSKLSDRGSLTVHSILTNVQDFIVTVERGLRERKAGC